MSKKIKFEVGEVALVEVTTGLYSAVKVLQVISEFGRTRYLVAPVAPSAGMGQAKVEHLRKRKNENVA